jgi:hypothetical protein
MLDLSDGSISKWMSKLPQDVLAALAEGDAPTPGGAPSLAAALGENVGAPQVPDLLREHPDEARALGRVGRVRLMAWVADNSGDNPGPVFRRLVGETAADETGGSGSAGSDAVGTLFLEDIRAIARNVTGPRLAARMVDDSALGMAIEAAATLESDLAFRQGGV